MRSLMRKLWRAGSAPTPDGDTSFWWFEADDNEETRKFFDHYSLWKEYETDDPAQQHPMYGSVPPMHAQL